jgi:hypothetical protein
MREPSIRTRGGVRITGLLGRPGRLPEVTGVRTSEGQVQGDLVIDAPGRTSPAFSWLQADLTPFVRVEFLCKYCLMLTLKEFYILFMCPCNRIFA